MTDERERKIGKHPASFINAIAEEGSKSEAIYYLQDTWDKLCDVRTALAAKDAEIERLSKEYYKMVGKAVGHEAVSIEQAKQIEQLQTRVRELEGMVPHKHPVVFGSTHPAKTLDCPCKDAKPCGHKSYMGQDVN